MSITLTNRRRFERFSLKPMYNEVHVQRVRDGRMQRLDGSAYDVSEGGMRVELDERLEQGEHVNATLVLPGYDACDERQGVHAACETVWVNDEDDDPAMPRMALRIVRFLTDASRDRLLNYLGSDIALRAA